MSSGKNNWIQRKIDALCSKLERNILSDKSLKCKVVFGPVRSRRLGYILGINNIKPDVCSYNCVYCPSGRKSNRSISTNSCLSPYELYISMRRKLSGVDNFSDKINYIAFTGSGEPLLDSELSNEIKILREFGCKIAVFSNASLIWNEHLRENLKFADFVSLKVDTVNEKTWKKINRPHRRLQYDHILEGIKQFSKEYRGILTTETMLIKNLNDSPDEIENLANYLNTVKRKASYFTSPLFPPEECYAVAPDTDYLDKLKFLIKDKVSKAVLLCCPENEEFIATDDFENELLGLLAIHPVGTDAVKHYIKDEKDSIKLREMIDKHIIKEIEFAGKYYYKETVTG
ncbi:MAG: radical SAM protein [Ignavibacteria bacterium]|nr:radical SAM protein [Ignavibacteria bacterium]